VNQGPSQNLGPGSPILESDPGKTPKVTSVDGFRARPGYRAVLNAGLGEVFKGEGSSVVRMRSYDASTGAPLTDEGSWPLGIVYRSASISSLFTGQRVGARVLHVDEKSSANAAPPLTVTELLAQFS
jgi:hypothetical protein